MKVHGTSAVLLGLHVLLFTQKVGESKKAFGTENHHGEASEESSLDKGIIGRASLSTSSCDIQNQHCRKKRQNTLSSESESGQIHDKIVLETAPVALFPHQHATDKNGKHVIKPIIIKLAPSSFPLIGPNYKLVIRDDTEDQKKPENHTRVPLPNCLFNGTLFDNDQVQVAISTCGSSQKKVVLNGILVNSKKQYVIEPISTEEHHSRVKRENLHETGQEDGVHLVLIYETSGGKCGLQSQNRKRLYAPDLHEKTIKLQQETPVQHSQYSSTTKNSRNTIEFQKKLLNRRRKRQTSNNVNDSPENNQKAIEIAVFVDDDLYYKTKKANSGDPIKAIQNLVFAYLNSVQLLYQSSLLDTKFQIVLVRLEIFKSPLSALDKKDGNIEGYLESFCKWQSKENPEYWDKLSDHPDHWDHGLMLTGLDLYDGTKKQTSVIGLAWVSGMCHPEYSCTINEGNNFESVYVIAHEMGHNLGMNHDGETSEGNDCDANSHLMSPILGPGKVTWSQCSNQEINNFLNNRATKDQAKCLDDVPAPVARYDFLRQGQRPGEQFKAIKQCQQSFGPTFIPHVKPNEKPFDDLCRELWCSNDTHALRAHPALEGTDCSGKPYPYGSICIEGICSPFYPDGVDIPVLPDIDQNDIDTGKGNRNKGKEQDRDNEPIKEPLDIIDGRPAWYDPIFTKVFEELRILYEERFENNL